jgi:hypothetical protein
LSVPGDTGEQRATLLFQPVFCTKAAASVQCSVGSGVAVAAADGDDDPSTGSTIAASIVVDRLIGCCGTFVR